MLSKDFWRKWNPKLRHLKRKKARAWRKFYAVFCFLLRHSWKYVIVIRNNYHIELISPNNFHKYLEQSQSLYSEQLCDDFKNEVELGLLDVLIN